MCYFKSFFTKFCKKSGFPYLHYSFISICLLYYPTSTTNSCLNHYHSIPCCHFSFFIFISFVECLQSENNNFPLLLFLFLFIERDFSFVSFCSSRKNPHAFNTPRNPSFIRCNLPYADSTLYLMLHHLLHQCFMIFFLYL